MIRQRSGEAAQKTSRELLANWQPNQELDLYKPSLDQDMTLLSRRAVLKNRVDEAITYLRRLLVQYPKSSLREKAARHLDQALNRRIMALKY